MAPGRDLIWLVWFDALSVMGWFALTYPEWDFAFDIQREGVEGDLGQCTFTTRLPKDGERSRGVNPVQTVGS